MVTCKLDNYANTVDGLAGAMLLPEIPDEPGVLFAASTWHLLTPSPLPHKVPEDGAIHPGLSLPSGTTCLLRIRT